MALKGIKQKGATAPAVHPQIPVSPLADGPARGDRFACISTVLSTYIERERTKVHAYSERKRTKPSADSKTGPAEPKPSYIPLSFCERAERIISELAARHDPFPALTESLLRDVQGGTSFRNDAYDLRQAMSRSPEFGLDMTGVTALDLVLVAAGIANASHRPLSESVWIRGSGFNPVPSRAKQREAARKGDPYDPRRAKQREAARKGDPYDPRPPVKVGSGAKAKPGFRTEDPYKGKQELAPELLAQAPFQQAIAFFGTYELAPRFVKFELFPMALELADGKPEILAALLLPESISPFSTRAAFYTDLKNALNARNGKIPSVKVAGKIVQKVLSDRALGKMPEQTTAGTKAAKRISRLDVQNQPGRELPAQFIKSLPPILDPDAGSKS